jgi:hypothetical protein
MSRPLSFLRQSSASLPISTAFNHDLTTASGEVALQYWPRRDGASEPPSQLTLFVLGKFSTLRDGGATGGGHTVDAVTYIEGNPGLLDYYIPFLNHLHSLLPPTHALLSTSHIGHTPGLRSPAEPLDLPAQLDAKVELVTGLRAHLDEWAESTKSAQTPKLCLMGHSVGAWFVCELMKQLEDAVQGGYLLFPTVGWIADSWNGRTLWVRPALYIGGEGDTQWVDASQYFGSQSRGSYPCCPLSSALCCRSRRSRRRRSLSCARPRRYGTV